MGEYDRIEREHRIALDRVAIAAAYLVEARRSGRSLDFALSALEEAVDRERKAWDARMTWKPEVRDE